jgi:hypothetical protein
MVGMVAGSRRYFVGFALFDCVWSAKVLLSSVFWGRLLREENNINPNLQKATENEYCKKTWIVIGFVCGGILRSGGNGNGKRHYVDIHGV